MSEWTATIVFPDGQVRLARFSSSAMGIGQDLYPAEGPGTAVQHAALSCATSHADPVVQRQPLASHPDRALSPADELVLVQVTPGQSGYDGWTALYCPSRRQILGPLNAGFDTELQQHVDLVPQAGLDHLVANGGRTLCGLPASAPPVRYRRPLRENGVAVEVPAARNLLEEWDDGQVCRSCLVVALARTDAWSS